MSSYLLVLLLGSALLYATDGNFKKTMMALLQGLIVSVLAIALWLLMIVLGEAFTFIFN